MERLDASRDNGTIGVSVCPFGGSVSDEQSDEKPAPATRDHAPAT